MSAIKDNIISEAVADIRLNIVNKYIYLQDILRGDANQRGSRAWYKLVLILQNIHLRSPKIAILG